MHIHHRDDNDDLILLSYHNSLGGVWIMSSAYIGRPDAIIVRNSLEARLDSCIEYLTPTIRGLMFPEDEKRAKEVAESRAKAMAAMAEGH